jgi:hypothetical protein
MLVLCMGLGGKTAHAQRFLNPLLQFAEKKQPIFGLDNRRTHVRGKWGVIYGAYSGIGMGKHLRLKIGVSASPFGLGEVDPVLPQSRISRLGFLTLGEEVDFFRHGKFTWTSYLQGGIGYDYFQWLDPQAQLLEAGREAIFPLELGLQTSFQINAWLAAKAGGGWRWVFPENRHDLGGFYLKFGLGFNPIVFWRTAVPGRKPAEAG